MHAWILALLLMAMGSPRAYSKESRVSKEGKPQTELATLAGGCFWGMEQLILQIPGVISTRVGYAGGGTVNPTYEVVKKGNTGHAEAVEITFDPKVASYEELLIMFFRMHDPTTLNQQGNDVGSQYRSVIFFHSPEQQEKALNTIKNVNARGVWKKPIVTEVIPAKTFYLAEEYHQKYLQKNPKGYTCHFLRNW